MAFNDTRNDTQSNELNQEPGSHHEPPTAQAQSNSNLNPNTNSSERPKVGSTRSDKETMTEDFATALESFEQEQNELAANEDRVLKGTVISIITEESTPEMSPNFSTILLISVSRL